jgi:hypothetical protein
MENGHPLMEINNNNNSSKIRVVGTEAVLLPSCALT